jgi:hypothetical protein
MIKNFFKLIALFIVINTLFTSCKKYDDNLTVAPSLVNFNSNGGTYFVTNSSTSQFKIPVSLTAVRSEATTVSFNVTSPTGAVSGVQYTLAPSTVTIPAGRLSDTLRVNGIFAGFPGNRRDTLVITIASSNAGILEERQTYRLVMSKACDVVFSQLSGNYNNTREFQGGSLSWGPYTTTVSNFVSTGPTSATCQIANLYDDGWNPITVNLDYSNPANYVVTIPLQPTGKNYNGGATSIRTTAGRVNTFSSCNQTFTFFADLVNPGNVVLVSGYEFRLER